MLSVLAGLKKISYLTCSVGCLVVWLAGWLDGRMAHWLDSADYDRMRISLRRSAGCIIRRCWVAVTGPSGCACTRGNKRHATVMISQKLYILLYFIIKNSRQYFLFLGILYCIGTIIVFKGFFREMPIHKSGSPFILVSQTSASNGQSFQS